MNRRFNDKIALELKFERFSQRGQNSGSWIGISIKIRGCRKLEPEFVSDFLDLKRKKLKIVRIRTL